MLSRSAVREIALSRKVDFGREIGPEDGRAFDGICNEVEVAAGYAKGVHTVESQITPWPHVQSRFRIVEYAR